jgi:hypothetical protein
LGWGWCESEHKNKTEVIGFEASEWQMAMAGREIVGWDGMEVLG